MSGKELCLLSLDGGGVRGLSALQILKQLMETINPDAPPKPCEYFDMIGGTSTGGLMAIMLGRLQMTIEDCITAYVNLSDRIFKKQRHRVTIKGTVQGRFDTDELERAIKEIVVQSGLPEDALLWDNVPARCKVFVCATAQETSDTVRFTSYRTHDSSDLLQVTKIWEAARATSAASSFFDPITIGVFGERFVDGAVGNNNPVRALWSEAKHTWSDEPLENSLKCLVSIGTGMPSVTSFGSSLLEIAKTLKDIATETERTAEAFHQEHAELDNSNRYFRFNVLHGLEDVGLEDAEQKSFIMAVTRRYARSAAVVRQMQICGKNIHERQHVSQYLQSESQRSYPAFPHFDPGDEISRHYIDRPELSHNLTRLLSQRLPVLNKPDKTKILGAQAPDSRSKSPQTVIVYGLAGSGKSQLVRQYAQSWLQKHDSFYWMDATSLTTINRNYLDFATEVGLAGISQATVVNPDFVRQKVRRYVADHPRQWLLIFDNYDIMGGEEEGYFNIGKYLPTGVNGNIIVTTRNRDVENNIEGQLLEVTSMIDVEAITLFDEAAGLPESQDLSDEWYLKREIAFVLLGSHPLTIAQGGAYIRGFAKDLPTDQRLRRYQEEYDSHRAIMLKADNGVKVASYGQSVIITFDMSFEVISRNNREAAEMLLLFGFFHHSHIPIELFQRAFAERDKLITEDGIDLTAESYEWLRKILTSTKKSEWNQEVYFENAMRILENYSLIQRPSKSYWNVHPLVHTWTLFSKQHPQLNSIDERAHLALTLLGRMLNKDMEKKSPSMQQVQTELSNHIESCIRTATNHTNALDPSHLPILPASTLLKCETLFGYEYQSVDNKIRNVGTKLTLLALINGSQREGLDYPSTLRALQQTVGCLMVRSDYRLTGLETLIQITLQLLDKAVSRDTTVDVVKTRFEFLAAQSLQINWSGDSARALKAIEQGLIYSNVHRDELSDAARLRLNGVFLIGLTAGSNEDVAAEALVAVEKHIHECDDVLGQAHVMTVEAKVCKGICFKVLGRLEEAETLVASQVALCQALPATLGGVIVRVLLFLEMISIEQDRLLDRLKWLEMLREAYIQTGGEFHPEALSTICDLFHVTSDLEMEKGRIPPFPIYKWCSWDGKDDSSIFEVLELVIAYKVFQERHQIPLLWEGVIQHARLAETPGSDLKDFAVALRIAADAGRRQNYSSIRVVLEDHATSCEQLSVEDSKKQGEARSSQLVRLKLLWDLLELIDEHSNSDKIEFSKEEIGSRIRNHIKNVPSHAKRSSLYLCVLNLERLFFSETAVSSLPLDLKSLAFLLRMTSREFGSTDRLTFQMHMICAISQRLMGLEDLAIINEDVVIQHRIEYAITTGQNIRSGSVPSPLTHIRSSTGAWVLERSFTEYKRRSWYIPCIRMYEKTTSALIKILGVEHSSSAIDIRFLFELYCRLSLQDKFDALVSSIGHEFDVAIRSRKKAILQSMRSTCSHLYRAKMFQPALEVLNWISQRGEPTMVATGYIAWRVQVMEDFNKIHAAIGNTELAEEY